MRLPFETTDNPLPIAASLELYRGFTVEDIPIAPEDFTATELTLLFSGSDQILIDSARLLLQDECGDTLITNAVSPVYLFAEPAPGGATLDWTPLVNNLPGAITYTVLAVNPDGSFTPLADSLTDLTYLDQSPPPAGGPRCYRIAATYALPDSTATFSFLSNQVCLFEEPEVFFPNVFSPTAQQPENRVFGPIFGAAPSWRATSSSFSTAGVRWSSLPTDPACPGPVPSAAPPPPPAPTSTPLATPPPPET